MSRTGLTPRDRRAVWIGALVILCALVGTYVVRPLLTGLGQMRVQLEAERALLSREHDLVRWAAQLPGLVGEAEQVWHDSEGHLFDGPNEIAASAALVRYLAERASANRVFIRRSETLTPTLLDAGLVRLEVEIEGATDLEGLIGFLVELQRGGKLVRVDQIQIRGSESGRNLRARGGELAFNATVVGIASASEGEADSVQLSEGTG